MRMIAAVVLLGISAGSAAAQQSGVIGRTSGVNDRVANAMRTTYVRYEGPKCEAADDDLHFKVSSAKVYLRTGLETEIDDNKARALENGQRVTLEAITENGQASSPGAWYFLGRIYLQRGDLPGADSAFSKAATLAPECVEDINTYRRTAWVALVNPGVDFMKAENTDSAKALFALATTIHPAGPHAYFYQASMAYEAGQMEQALALFDSTLATPKTEANAAVHEQAQFNKALALINLKRGPEAIAVLRPYTAEHPDDLNAKKALLNAFSTAGMPDSAAAVAAQLEAAGETVVKTAVVDAESPFNRAVSLFNEKQFAEAAVEAEKVVAAEPYNRDALYMLARSYYELKKGPELVRTAERLLAVDPMSESGVQMLGLGHNLTKNSNKAVATRLRLNALPLSLSNVVITPGTGGVTLAGEAAGRTPMNANGQPIAPKPVTLVFEFLNADGAVVTTAEAAVPALKPAETHAISLTPQGAGIVAWRYKQK